jgi:hypothetical protein
MVSGRFLGAASWKTGQAVVERLEFFRGRIMYRWLIANNWSDLVRRHFVYLYFVDGTWPAQLVWVCTTV